jgi:hypothetical protein
MTFVTLSALEAKGNNGLNNPWYPSGGRGQKVSKQIHAFAVMFVGFQAHAQSENETRRSSGGSTPVEAAKSP